MPFDQSRSDPSGIDRNAPVITGGAGLGGSPPAPTIDAQASDAKGTVSFGTGTTPAAGILFTVTFARPRDPNRLPHVILSESTQATAGVDVAVTGLSATGFNVVHNTRLAGASQPAGTYAVTYLVVD